MIRYSFLIIFILALIQLINLSNCSVGDDYPSYRSCVRSCRIKNCLDRNSYVTSVKKSWLIKILWNCYDDCDYECMWPTVEKCQKYNWRIPQFKGKWPFVRWLGIQEPASVIFSFLNLLGIIIMYRQFYRTIQTTSLMYWNWTAHTIIAINAWTWSILFHTRDVPLTERMDYIGSSLLIYFTFFAIGLRIFVFEHFSTKLIFILGCSFFFIQHISYLTSASFDYDHNIVILVFIGLLTGVSTLLWSMWNYSDAAHVKYIAAYVINVISVAALEVFDFPPIFWVFDAHSLWHLGTVPVSYFLYKFVIEDCRYLRRVYHQATVSTVDLIEK